MILSSPPTHRHRWELSTPPLSCCGGRVRREHRHASPRRPSGGSGPDSARAAVSLRGRAVVIGGSAIAATRAGTWLRSFRAGRFNPRPLPALFANGPVSGTCGLIALREMFAIFGIAASAQCPRGRRVGYGMLPTILRAGKRGESSVCDYSLGGSARISLSRSAGGTLYHY